MVLGALEGLWVEWLVVVGLLSLLGEVEGMGGLVVVLVLEAVLGRGGALEVCKVLVLQLVFLVMTLWVRRAGALGIGCLDGIGDGVSVNLNMWSPIF
jgi:hypothetical protein